LVRQDFPYWVPHEDEDDNVDVMEADEMVIDVLDDEFIDRTASPVNGSLFDVVRNEVAIANVCEEFQELETIIEASRDHVVMAYESGEDDPGYEIVYKIPDMREYLLVNTCLSYGRVTLYDVKESSILRIQEKLRVGFDKIVNGVSPYEFSSIHNREVDWVTALEVTRDFVSSNESVLCGNRRLQTTSNAVKRETGLPARLPKRIGTLLHAFSNDLETYCPIREWNGSFFDEYLDEKKKEEMHLEGVRWTNLRGHFIPLHSAIAQLLLRLKVEDFDNTIGPCYKDVKLPSGLVRNVRSYSSFNSSRYAIDMQKQLNSIFVDDPCKPVLLSIAFWVDKSLLNSNMTHKNCNSCHDVFNERQDTYTVSNWLCTRRFWKYVRTVGISTKTSKSFKVKEHDSRCGERI
jgi:hypothetical protein